MIFIQKREQILKNRALLYNQLTGTIPTQFRSFTSLIHLYDKSIFLSSFHSNKKIIACLTIISFQERFQHLF